MKHLLHLLLYFSYRRFLIAILTLSALGIPTAWAQAPYPNKPISFIVPYGTSGSSDLRSRQITQKMSVVLKQSFIVENKPGAGGMIGLQAAAKATPDGYTIHLHHMGMATANALYDKLPYDPMTSFEYIGQVVDVPMTLLGRKDLPAKNLQELSSYVKAKDNREAVDITQLNAELKTTVAKIDQLRKDIDAIVAAIEGEEQQA